MSRATDTTPVIVVVRHPDYGTEIALHGLDAQVINVDLGGSFDMGHSCEYDDSNAAHDYADELEREIADLSADHPAREQLVDIIEQIREWAGEDEREDEE